MKRRAESFFGMHFDFHANKDQVNIGSFCDYETIDKLLEEVKPDYVQCDTKGHEGISSYPTKIGTQADEMKGDVLRMWREETKKHDVALFSHYSGVWDAEAIKKHPDWGAINADGKPDEIAISVFGPYSDELLIPQIKELAKDYDMNGVWVDGDCWGAVEDYSHWAREAYKNETGLDLPKEDDLEGREKYRNFCRKIFLAYVEHYCSEIHKSFPDFQIACNWLYTAYVPEPETVSVDFVSGDYSPNNSLNSARFEGRAMQNLEKPWDLMCWGFTSKPRVSKELVQLCLEASEVIALGGGFSIYNPQLVGTIEKQYIDKWAKLAEFCREREKTCHKAKPVHEGALIYSRQGSYYHKMSVFRRWSPDINKYGEDARGILTALIDAGYSTEILQSHQFMKLSDEELSKYGFFAISDLDTIEEDIKERLKKYVKNGGEVIVCGPGSTKVFEKELGVKIEYSPEGEKTEHKVVSGEKSGPIVSNESNVTLNGATALDWYYTNKSKFEREKKIFSTVNNDGKGKWIGIYLSYCEYQYARSASIRDITESLIKLGYARKKVEIEKTHIPEVILTQKDGRLNVNLINTSGPHADSRCLSYDEIIPLRDLHISVEYPKKPSSVVEIPSGKHLDFKYNDGRVELVLDKLEIHSVITIE
ncbi:MAG: alpha-L-fucosidase [Clostridiales bacterium]|nr:alpha-L-fucosidase [Clostridiales bacterium]